MGRLAKKIDDAFADFKLDGRSLPAKILIGVAVIGASVFTVAIFAIDLLSAHSSSTAALIFVVMTVYTVIAVLAIVAVDWALQKAIRRARGSRSDA
jgi:hypothetical protein